MSLYFVTTKEIRFTDLFDGGLEKFGVRELLEVDSKSDSKRCLTDGSYCLWVYANSDGILDSLTIYGVNQPVRVFEAIAKTFDTGFFSENQFVDWFYDKEGGKEADLEEMDLDSIKEEIASHARAVQVVGDAFRAGKLDLTVD